MHKKKKKKRDTVTTDNMRLGTETWRICSSDEVSAVSPFSLSMCMSVHVHAHANIHTQTHMHKPVYKQT